MKDYKDLVKESVGSIFGFTEASLVSGVVSVLII